MKKIICFLILIFFSTNLLANSLDYKDLDKIKKKSTFVDDRGKTYSITDISNKKKTLLIIDNHGSDYDIVKDSCQKKPKLGYTWHGATVPAILKLHNKKIKDLTIKIYRLCSGVKGMSLKTMKKYRNQLENNGTISNIEDETKNIKRQKIIFKELEKFQKEGFENIVLSGFSAGAWASLNLQSKYPDKIKGVIAINPAAFGKKIIWNKKYPEWGFFRKTNFDYLKKSKSLNSIIFTHNKDKFETPETLSFFRDIKGVNFIDYSELKPANCKWADAMHNMGAADGHEIPQSSCFTRFIEKNNYLIKFLEEII
ncbi:hypothetical protein [Candidatus Pelagibacter sp.]|uniref:hypothetical protein n=1 Tax=Candidatus Pelagibacter sp. TaxID=2024849 RepID=UPI003F872939